MFDSTMPIDIQVIHELKLKIVRGVLPLGSRLPSARELAIHYQINLNTAARIYKEMEVEELCYTRKGLGTFITENERIITIIRNEMADELLSNFLSGMTDLGYEKEEVVALLSKKLEESKKES